MKEIYKVKTTPKAKETNIIKGENYRISILTDALVRFEYSNDGNFEDRASQMVWHRDFPDCDYTVNKTDSGIEIYTKSLAIYYNEKEFSKQGLRVEVKGNLSAYHSAWNYSEEISTLGGTARTLDLADGEIPLENGIISKNGFSMLDDSETLLLLEDGWVAKREKRREDFYFFGYGHDYKKALKDFYSLCGKSPLLPRYALGNWWSRYYKYTEKSYLELMDKFKDAKLPFSVAVIDMDWHKTDIDPKYGSGWTGYSWNKDYFPDPKRFLNTLKDRGLVTTLNVHPADGVRAFEDCYENIADALNVNKEIEAPVTFDASSPDFINAYFEHVHHPLEEDGVDFWWIDWQQNGGSKEEGYDPLWMLNHYHFLDNKRSGKRPLTFSRYAGPGSHRYPVGFSGDSIVTWESLKFQPYFTSTASNIGYGWWSHDIGGHMMGYRDDELSARWVQFGIFSPIMRLHSSCSEFNTKEPWTFKKEAETVMNDSLRMRHKLMPYLYTMNYRSHSEGLPICLPLYYEHPDENLAYTNDNAYYFGSSLIVNPATSPRIKGLNVSKTTCFLPKGTYFDFYTNRLYLGGRTLEVYRDLSTIPVFAKAGSIIPLAKDYMENMLKNNLKSLEINIYAGENGTFTMYEDDNNSCDFEDGKFVLTDFVYEENSDFAKFTVKSVDDKYNLLPEKRDYTLNFIGNEYSDLSNISVLSGDKEIPFKLMQNGKIVTITVSDIEICKELTVKVGGIVGLIENDVKKAVFDFLNQAEIDFSLKETIYNKVSNSENKVTLMADIFSMNIDRDLFGAIIEIITAY